MGRFTQSLDDGKGPKDEYEWKYTSLGSLLCSNFISMELLLN